MKKTEKGDTHSVKGISESNNCVTPWQIYLFENSRLFQALKTLSLFNKDNLHLIHANEIQKLSKLPLSEEQCPTLYDFYYKSTRALPLDLAGYSLVHVMIEVGAPQTLEILLQNGYASNSYNTVCGSPLSLACRKKRYDAVRKLLNYGAKLNLPGATIQPLEELILNGDLSDLKNTLIVEMRQKGATLPPHLLAQLAYHLTQQQRLLKEPSLILAIKSLFMTLITQGANVDVSYNNKNALEHMASGPSAVEVLEVLYENKVAVNENSILKAVADNNTFHYDNLKFLANHGATIEAKDDNGTPVAYFLLNRAMALLKQKSSEIKGSLQEEQEGLHQCIRELQGSTNSVLSSHVSAAPEKPITVTEALKHILAAKRKEPHGEALQFSPSSKSKTSYTTASEKLKLNYCCK